MEQPGAGDDDEAQQERAELGIAAATATGPLVVLAVKSVDRQQAWRRLLVEAGNVEVEAVEFCLGLLTATSAGYSHVLVVIALPPVLMPQRGLLQQQLKAAARTDGKTGLLNAATWEREAADRLAALSRRGQPAALLLIDVDRFTTVNDVHGHLVGDRFSPRSRSR